MQPKYFNVVALIAALAVAVTVRAESAGDRLHKGVYQEETVGDLEAAIKIYREIVADDKANRPHVALAKFRLGMCYFKKGQNEEAVETFEELIEEFPGQANLLDQARSQLTALGHSPESDPAGVQLEVVWAYSGLAELNVLAVSRDGRYCAFVDNETGGLMVRDLTTEKDQQVAEKVPGIISYSTNWQRASISPDNQWVAYVGHGSDPESRSCLRIAAVDGSGDRILYPNEEKSVIRDLGWSADSQHVLGTFCDTPGERSNLNDVSVRIATVSLTDGSPRLLVTLTPEENDGPEPVFSPDGRYVAYARMMNTTSEQEDVFLIPLDGGPEIRLTEDPGDDDVLGWMPDSRGLLIRSSRGENYDDAWLVRLTDGKPAGAPRLVETAVGADLEGPVRTPTGGWAFYYANVQRRAKRNVFIAGFDPEEGRIVGEPRPASERFPDDTYRISGWSPDGESLAYHADSRKPRWPRDPRFLVVRSTQTGHERAIELGENRIPGPVSWSPDGRSILLSSEFGRFGPLLRLDVEQGVITPIGPITASGEFGSSQQPIGWSPDGKTVFAFRNRYAMGHGYDNGQILMHNLETGQETELHHEEDEGIFACDLSPDGAQIAYAFPVYNERSLMLMPTAGGEPRKLFSVPDSEKISDAVTWTPDGRHLLFWKITRGAGQSPSSYELWRISAEGGRPEKLAWESQAKVMGLRLHPSGRQVAFSTSLSANKNHIRMMQMVLSPEWATESCSANLKTIGEAIKRYEHDHGDVPDHLSSLYPDYLNDPSLLLCPAHDERQEKRFFNDPEMASSYEYIRGGVPRVAYYANHALPAILPDKEMPRSEILKLRLKYFGEISGLLECDHHNPDLQLAHDGKIHEASWWGGDGRADKGLLSQLRAAMESNPKTWIEDYDIPKLVSLLEDRTALTDVLRSYIKAHPGDASVSAKQALDEARRVRFITRSEDDAQESNDGQMDLNSDSFWLADDESRGGWAVGLRFTDIQVPQGARIKRAYVQFKSDAWGTGANQGLICHGELAADAAPFQDVKRNITSRRKTVASVECPPEIWDWRSLKCRTSDLASIIREITAQPDWREGAALVLIISGSSQGSANSWDGDQEKGGPMLYVEVE